MADHTIVRSNIYIIKVLNYRDVRERLEYIVIRNKLAIQPRQAPEKFVVTAAEHTKSI
jgi:hypothetical protein